MLLHGIVFQVVTLQEEIEFLGSQLANISYSSQNGSQLNNMPEFVNPMTVDTTSFVNESLLNNDDGRNCLDGFFSNSEEMLVNHPWLQNMDYYNYNAPQNQTRTKIIDPQKMLCLLQVGSMVQCYDNLILFVSYISLFIYIALITICNSTKD